MNPRPERKRPGAAGRTLVASPEPLQVGDAPTSVEPQEKPDTSKGRTPEVPESRTSEHGEQPKYLTFERTEARLRPDQIQDLSKLRRRIRDARTVRTERITDNTLMRLAVDLLLANADKLHGNTEDELRKSVVPEVTD